MTREERKEQRKNRSYDIEDKLIEIINCLAGRENITAAEANAVAAVTEVYITILRMQL